MKVEIKLTAIIGSVFTRLDVLTAIVDVVFRSRGERRWPLDLFLFREITPGDDDHRGDPR